MPPLTRRMPAIPTTQSTEKPTVDVVSTRVVKTTVVDGDEGVVVHTTSSKVETTTKHGGDSANPIDVSTEDIEVTTTTHAEHGVAEVS